MPGTYIFRPIEANLKGKSNIFGQNYAPYCKIKMGSHKVMTQACIDGGNNPQWNESLVIKADTESSAIVELKDKYQYTSNKRLGEIELSLNDIQSQGKILQWFDIKNKDKIEGQIHLEVTYSADDLQSQKFDFQGKDVAGIFENK